MKTKSAQVVPLRSSSFPTSVHAEFKVRIAEVNSGNRGRAKNTRVTWDQLCERLGPARVAVDQQHTIEQFLALPLDEQNLLKDVGSFVGGPFRDGIRKSDHLEGRYLLTLDVDSAKRGDIEDVKAGLTGICDYEFVAYSTRRHTPDKPKFRIVLPLARPVNRKEFAALSRIVGSTLFDSVEASMDAIDNVSFTYAQIMYWPAICRGSKFDYFRNFGRLVDPDKVLAAWGAWQDWTQLPHSDKRKAVRPASGKKAENPKEKRGIVGAFCRAYSVPEAIKKFLPDVYVPGEDAGGKQRYTFVQGSSTNGAIVEDDGLFLFSHHGTDPCGERLVNAFDLVRIHLFGDKDQNVNENDAAPTRMPSYKAMVAHLEDDGATKRQSVEDRYDMVAMYDDLPEEDLDPEGHAGEPEDYDDGFNDVLGPMKPAKTRKKVDKAEPGDPDWIANELELGPNGEIRSTLTNVATILQRDPRFRGLVAYNSMKQGIVARRSLRSRITVVNGMSLEDRENGDTWTDFHDTAVRAILEAPAGKDKPG